MTIGRWNDLGERIGVGAVVAGIGLLCVWMGGVVFAALTVLVTGIMVWELVRMLDAEAPAIPLAMAAGSALIVAEIVPVAYALPLLIAPVFAGIALLKRRRVTFALFTVLIVVAGLGLYILRTESGFIWMLWLALVVIATDVFGYLVGRQLGGAKLWPRVSPSKTWSGTIGGWVASALVGAAFMLVTEANAEIVTVSIALSMAAQIGDIAESAVKRRAGVKDSSSLLPGHGGLFDRFDGMLGAAVFFLLVAQIIDFPPGIVAG